MISLMRTNLGSILTSVWGYKMEFVASIVLLINLVVVVGVAITAIIMYLLKGWQMKIINIKNDENEALHLYDMTEIETKITVNGKTMTVKEFKELKGVK